MSTSNTFDIEETYVVIPPDGGWGWVIVFASFLCMVMVDGIINTYGIFIEDISKSLETSKANVALANSLMAGCALLFAPFVGALMNRYGFRIIGFLGGLLCVGVFVVTSQCENICVLLLVYGVFGGIGMGLLFIAALAIVGFYFEKWRALATSLAVSGSCVGTLAMSPIMNVYLSEYDWRFKFQVIGAASLGTCLASLTFRPIKPSLVRPMASSDLNSTGAPATPRTQRLSMSANHNLRYSTISEIYKRSSVIPLTREVSSVSSLVQSVEESFTSLKPKEASSMHFRKKPRLLARMQKCCNISNCCTSTPAPLTRPLYRDDIFYHGSLAKLPQYSRSLLRPSTSQKPVEYHLSVTRIPSQREMEERTMCKICGEAVTRVLATMLDVSLLKLASFNILSISGFLTVLGVYTPYCFLEQAAEEKGVPHDLSLYLLTIVGLSNLFGRISCGVISCVTSVDPIFLQYVSLMIGGLAAVFTASCKSASCFFACAMLFGFCLASMPSLRSVIICELVGLEHLTNALGLNLMMQGVSSIVGLPLSAYLQSATGSYEFSFIFAGSCILLSAILLIPLRRIRQWELRKAAEREAERLAEQQRKFEIINRPYKKPMKNVKEMTNRKANVR